jgi:hypothetical protein
VRLAATIVQQVRERAGRACEYCGVTESDAGGEHQWIAEETDLLLELLRLLAAEERLEP